MINVESCRRQRFIPPRSGWRTSLGLALALVLTAGCPAAEHRPTPTASTRATSTAAATPGPSRRSAAAQAGRDQAAAAKARLRQRQAAAVFAREALHGRGPCFGAAAFTAPATMCAATARDPFTPALARVATDKSDAYPSVSGEPTCFSHRPWFPVVVCVRGDPAATTRVALVGNSHAGQWLPALEVLARRYKWRIDTYLASNCAATETRQTFTPASVVTACEHWVNAAVAHIAAGHYRLVVISNKVSVTALGHSLGESWRLYEQGYARVLRVWRRAHLTVLAIRDTPMPSDNVPHCLAIHRRDYSACAGRRSAWIRPEPILDAVRALHDPRITAADLTDYFCTATCPAVVGRVVVYFDESHVTATYARTLASFLGRFVPRAVKRI